MTHATSSSDRRMTVPGYSLAAEIHRGRKHVVFRAIRERDGQPVILKTLLDEYPSPGETAALRREYELLRELDIPGVAAAQGLETNRDRPALVLEDVGGVSLMSLVTRGPLDLGRFFDVALPLAATIGRLHEHGIIHKDINPNNVLVNLTTGDVRLIDFSIVVAPCGRAAPAARPPPPARRHARLHVARADRPDEPRGGPPVGPLLARRDVLRDADRRAALRSRTTRWR